MGEELKEDIDRDTGIEEGEADHRINEFRDLVRRLENIESGTMDGFVHLESGIKEGFARLESGINEGFARLVERMGAVASIAVDNGAAPMDSQTASEREQVPTETVNPDVDADFLEASWDDLAEALDI